MHNHISRHLRDLRERDISGDCRKYTHTFTCTFGCTQQIHTQEICCLLWLVRAYATMNPHTHTHTKHVCTLRDTFCVAHSLTMCVGFSTINYTQPQLRLTEYIINDRFATHTRHTSCACVKAWWFAGDTVSATMYLSSIDDKYVRYRKCQACQGEVCGRAAS